MIARLILPLALLAGAVQAHAVTSDVPPPRMVKPVELEMSRGGPIVMASYRETPPVIYGSPDRYVPVARLPRMSACRAAALVGMMNDDDRMGFDDMGFGDDGDMGFADADIGGFDDGFFGR